jgi:Icc-related predicted phosphoesterase
VGGRPLPAALLGQPGATAIRVVATGDLHCDATEESLKRLRSVVRDTEGADIVLLAGDLTADGRADEARAVAELFAGVGPPVVAVLGNHDLRRAPDELASILGEAGLTVLRASHRTFELAGIAVGVVGTTGCIGGFHGRPVPGLTRTGRRQLRRRVAGERDAIERGLSALSECALRIVLLHYSPTAETLAGEPAHLLPLLGCDELAAPIAAHGPDLVLHGHAHHGSFEGHIGRAPVYNVSLRPEPAGLHGFTVRAA